MHINLDMSSKCNFCLLWQIRFCLLNLARNWDFIIQILGSCLKLIIHTFKLSDLAWNWDIVLYNSWILLAFEIQLEKFLNLVWLVKTNLAGVIHYWKPYYQEEKFGVGNFGSQYQRKMGFSNHKKWESKCSPSNLFSC